MEELLQLRLDLDDAKNRIKQLEEAYEHVLRIHHEELYFMSEQMDSQRNMMQDLLNYSAQLMAEIEKLKLIR
jgi:hypothetical protein